MRVDVKILGFSLWLSLLTILIFPGSSTGTIGMKYGFPVSFFTFYHEDKWFIRGVNINLLGYFINVLIIYFIVLGIVIVIKKLFSGKG